MDGLLGPLTLFLGGKCFLYVVLAENVDFALKIQNPVFLSLSKKHVFVPWSFKMDHKKCDFYIFFADRNENKELRCSVFFLTSFLSLFTLSPKFMRQLRGYTNQQCSRRCFHMDQGLTDWS